MAITFSVNANQFPDNVTMATTATAIATWLGTLTVTTVYEISIEHHAGFWKVIILYA